jgi:hypothetical protein
MRACAQARPRFVGTIAASQAALQAASVRGVEWWVTLQVPHAAPLSGGEGAAWTAICPRPKAVFLPTWMYSPRRI